MLNPLIPLVIRFFSYAGIMALISFIIISDFKLQEFSETTYTEITQEITLVIIVGLLGFTARKIKSFRVLTTVMALFFLTHFIRELDAFWDHYVFDGFWQILAWSTVVVAVYILYKNWRAFLQQLTYIQDKYPFGILLIGLVVLHIFSRLYGMTENWVNLMEEAYVRVVKNASEESLELVGYSILLISVIELIVHIRKKPELDS